MREQGSAGLQCTLFSARLRVVAVESMAKGVIWRGVSAVFCALALWAAYLQLNDPDPERWFALYTASAFVALLSALGRGYAPLALAVCALALSWAFAIVPELLGRWTPTDLGASMSSARPEVEYGREFGGLAIVAGYCAVSWWVARRSARGEAPAAEHV